MPYISHLIAVSGLVWEDRGDEDQAIAGLLHDAIEDAKQTRESITGMFNDRVAGIVLSCTDTAGPIFAELAEFFSNLLGAPPQGLCPPRTGSTGQRP